MNLRATLAKSHGEKIQLKIIYLFFLESYVKLKRYNHNHDNNIRELVVVCRTPHEAPLSFHYRTVDIKLFPYLITPKKFYTSLD
ncbi:MAG: hypothetical protein QXX20_07970 [Candidatus Thermoplasmatota archaeon]